MKRRLWILIIMILISSIFGIYLILKGYNETIYLHFTIILIIIHPILTVLINYKTKKSGPILITIFALLTGVILFLTDLQKINSDCNTENVILCNYEPFIMASIYIVLVLASYFYGEAENNKTKNKIKSLRNEINELKKDLDTYENKLYSFKAINFKKKQASTKLLKDNIQEKNTFKEE